MAYFANGMESECFEMQCQKCILGDKGCPIFGTQYMYNYEACNNKTARAILDDLVSDNGECTMFRMFPDLMMKKEIHCSLCGNALLKEGAIFFTPPSDGIVMKYNICENCFHKIMYEKKELIKIIIKKDSEVDV